MGCILSSGRKFLVIAVKVGTRLYLASGHRLAMCSRMNAAWLIASSTAATFAGLGLSESNSISFLAHTALQRYMGRLSSEVCCSGAASEMLLGNDLLGLENYYLHTEGTRTGDRPAVKGPSLVRFTKPQETTWSLGLFLRRAIFVSPAHFLSISSLMKAASRILR
jgi:hypothetical protein